LLFSARSFAAPLNIYSAAAVPMLTVI